MPVSVSAAREGSLVFACRLFRRSEGDPGLSLSSLLVSPNAIALKGDPVRPQVSSSSPAIQFGRMGEKRVRRYVRNTDGRAKLKEDYVYVRGSIWLQ